MGTVMIIITLLTAVAELYPKASPLVADIFKLIRGEPVPDISQKEFEERIDKAIEALSPM